MSVEACKKAFIAVSELIAEKCGIDPESEECKRATQASLELIEEKCQIVVPDITAKTEAEKQERLRKWTPPSVETEEGES